ncbi:Cardiolipin synthase [subsurface metagenome]
MARKAAAGFLICFFLFHLACTSLPRSNPADDTTEAQGEGSLQFPGLRCCDVSGLRFYFTGDVFLQRAEELIRDARDYILINVFVIIDDQKGKHIIELLKQKMEENVRVYVITDSSSSFLSGFVEGRTAVPYLVERGIPVTEYNPIRANRTGRLPVFEYRDHQKFWLIDGETIVLGGQNIWAPSLNSPEELGTTDSMVEFRSSLAARELLSGFVREWNSYSMEKIKEEDFEVKPDSNGTNCLWLVHQDRFTNPLVGEMFDRLMDTAEEEIWLIQSYTLPDRSVIKKIRRLTAAGVKVNILFSSAYHSLDKFYYATGYRMLDLIRAGAVIWEYGNPKSHLHYKAVIVDDRWFTIGSANLNFRSCHLSKEVNILFEGSDLGAPMLENLEELKAGSYRVSEQTASERRGLRFLVFYLFLFFGG